MASLNKVMIIGRLGRDPETRNPGTQQAVTRFSIATDEIRSTYDGGKETKTEWHNITAFGRTGDLCSQYLHKGAMAYVEGRLQTRKFTTKDGIEKQSTEIVADRVQFLDKGQAREEAPAEPTKPATAPLFKQQTALDEMDTVPF